MANERLIDANAFLKSLEWECGDVCEQTEYSDYLEAEYGFSRDAISQLVQNAPTVDAAPVVHAHWEDGCAIHNGKEVYKSIDCSHCNEIFKTDDGEYWKERFKRCTFCGAIMDGERRTDGGTG